MPTRPLKLCAYPGCQATVPSGRCPAHAKRERSYDERRERPSKRGYGRRWERLRALAIARDGGFCCVCEQYVGGSAHVDHITPKSAGGQDALDNLQTLCVACHSRKTATEDGGFGRAPG